MQLLHAAQETPSDPSSISPSPLPPADVTNPNSMLQSNWADNAQAQTGELPNINGDDHQDEEDPERILETYRSDMVPYFPAVPIPQSMTVKDMKLNHPFTWLVLRAICCQNSTKQVALGLSVRQKLATEMIFEGNKSMDLLLGLLIFGGWSQYWIWNKPITTTMVQLAMSLAYDLGVLKYIPTEPRLTLPNVAGKERVRPKPSDRTMEERRAAIGLFSFSST